MPLWSTSVTVTHTANPSVVGNLAVFWGWGEARGRDPRIQSPSTPRLNLGVPGAVSLSLSLSLASARTHTHTHTTFPQSPHMWRVLLSPSVPVRRQPLRFCTSENFSLSYRPSSTPDCLGKAPLFFWTICIAADLSLSPSLRDWWSYW
jgi:hypothetical protein